MLLISLITEKFNELEVQHEESWRHWVQYPINIVPKWGGTDTPDSHCKLIVIAIIVNLALRWEYIHHGAHY